MKQIWRILLAAGLGGVAAGCGGGPAGEPATVAALAERLAREGCRVTAVTLSPAQLEAARQRIADAGLSDRVTIELRDYRDIAGQFDRIVSIEMIEAVGRAYCPG